MININIEYIKSQIIKHKKIYSFDAKFYIINNNKYLSLNQYKFEPYITNNILVCHPSNTLNECNKLCSENNRMLLGMPFNDKLTIGNCIYKGVIGGYIMSMSCSSYVKSVSIITGELEDVTITDEDELKYFRCSLGYFGIIYKIELKTSLNHHYKIHKMLSGVPFERKNHISILKMENIKEKYFSYTDIVLEETESHNEILVETNKCYECCVYVSLENLDNVFDIILRHYCEGFYLIIINILTTNNAYLDMTSKLNSDNDVLFCFNMGFKNWYEISNSKNKLDNLIDDLISYITGFCFAKYVNKNMMLFAKKYYEQNHINNIIKMKLKYDPNNVFTNDNLEFLFG